MFINIRGTFGSGKTTCVLSLLDYIRNLGAEESEIVVDVEGKAKAMAQKYHNIQGLKFPVVFMGRYVDHIRCGGADFHSFKGAHIVMEKMIRDLCEDHHIILEGSIASNSTRYQTMGAELYATKGLPCLFVRMVTPMEVCIERVKNRRLQKHQEKVEKAERNGKPIPVLPEFNPKHLEVLYQSVDRTQNRIIESGVPTQDLLSEPEVGQYLYLLLQKSENVIA